MPRCVKHFVTNYVLRGEISYSNFQNLLNISIAFYFKSLLQKLATNLHLRLFKHSLQDALVNNVIKYPA